ncbi:NAD(P)-binding protein [Rhizodiscina lignyota]|uniref:NAD(P)-binding protein n=1 Tax=Rhizodiscina lignyota TaxID=1504668 RepID=A0A9P4II67_9PEZI|nr:NAD(P)-binding protein [Rhizodiscina lignyota]
MSTAIRNPTTYWCPPVHHTVSEQTDPSNTTLHKPFVAVIIGSSRGIGRVTGISYARAGASGIVLTGRQQDTLSAAVADVRDAATCPGVDVRGVQCDVCSDADLQRLADEVKQHFGRIDALVVNAGVTTTPLKNPDGTEDWPKTVQQLDLADFRKTFEVNLFAVVGALKYLVPLVEAAGTNAEGGDGWQSPQSVIVVTSSSLHNYDPKLMAMGYSLSKYAAARMTEYVHEGHKEKGVCAFAIQPGTVMTVLTNRTTVAIDDIGLGGGLCVWLSKEKREWLSGRYIDARWDLEELTRRKDDIVTKDLLKLRMMM